MAAPSAVRRFLLHHDLRGYRRALGGELTRHPGLRLIPRLVELELELLGADGLPTNLDTALRESQRLTLRGEAGSGRSLALYQRAARWAWSEGGDRATLLLSLPTEDDGTTPPADLVRRRITAAGQPPAHLSAWLPTRRMAAAPGMGDWELLVTGWEELPAMRRDDWRRALCAEAGIWSQARIAVALPDDEPPWPSYAAVRIASPGPGRLASWLEILAPESHRAELYAALQAEGPLAPLAARVADVALLAWLAPRAGLASGRGDLYARALALRLSQVEGLDLPALERFACSGERPSITAPGLVEATADGGARLAHPLLRDYLRARRLIDGSRYDELPTLAGQERHEVARLCAAENVAATLDALWPREGRGREDWLTLAACLWEGRSSDVRRIAMALAGLKAREASGPGEAARGAAIHAGLLRQLNVAVADAVRGGAATRATVEQLEPLPRDLALHSLIAVALDGTIEGEPGWELADELLTALAAGEAEGAPALVERIAGATGEGAPAARRAYLAALLPLAQPWLATEDGRPALAALRDSDAGDDRLASAALAILDAGALAIDARLAGLGLLGGVRTPTGVEIVERACADQDPAVRGAASALLAQVDAPRALEATRRAACDKGFSWEVRSEAVERLVTSGMSAAAATLLACAADGSLPLYARLRCIHSLGTGELARLALDEGCDEEVRVAAVHLLGARGDPATRSPMLALLEEPATPPPVVAALCGALAADGDAAAVGPLLRALERTGGDVATALAIASALGRLAAPAAIPALHELLGPGALARLAEAVGPYDPQQPAEERLAEPEGLPEPVALRLALALSGNTTIADPPTSFGEFLAREADALRSASADALASIDEEAARAALRAALGQGVSGVAARALVAALGHGESRETADALESLIDDPSASPEARWLAARRLGEHPEGAAPLRRAIENALLDPFTRGAVAEALGRRGEAGAIPALRRAADDARADPHLRLQAVAGLGLLDDPAAEAALVRLANAPGEDPELRGAAAASLSPTMSAEARFLLRELLRERPPAALACGALRALGRAADREALPLMVRYCQDTQLPVVLAAIQAIADLGDPVVTPVLVRISQYPHADRAARLQAVGALLRLEGAEHRALLRSWLESGPVPLRLQALEHLLSSDGADEDLRPLLADRSCPLPMRLRLFQELADHPEAAPALLSVLQDTDDQVDLRGLAAQRLGARREAAAMAPILALATDQTCAMRLRLRCLEALGALGDGAAGLPLSRLVADEREPALLRREAAAALHALVEKERARWR